MPEKVELKTNGKMKLTGYIFLAVALLLTLLIFFNVVEDSETKIQLIKFWAGVGVALLFGNAGKHIAGGYAMSKAEDGK